MRMIKITADLYIRRDQILGIGRRDTDILVVTPEESSKIAVPEGTDIASELKRIANDIDASWMQCP